MSNATLKKAQKKLESAERRLSRIREENKESIETATRTAVTMGGAFAVAWFQGRYPERQEIMGVDASLIIGGGLTAAALMGWAGDQTSIVESLGTGALAVYAVRKGWDIGSEQAAAA